jgi:hypothetical protein
MIRVLLAKFHRFRRYVSELRDRVQIGRIVVPHVQWHMQGILWFGPIAQVGCLDGADGLRLLRRLWQSDRTLECRPNRRQVGSVVC